MTGPSSSMRLVITGNTDRNSWICSESPDAKQAWQTLTRAMTGEATLEDLLQLVQSAFEAGCDSKN